jgi:hypothetical protein
MLTGDTTTVNCNQMSAKYRTYLKSDAVTTAHHGIWDDRPRAQNATPEFYAYIKPIGQF